jgi:hypothetical protein
MKSKDIYFQQKVKYLYLNYNCRPLPLRDVSFDMKQMTKADTSRNTGSYKGENTGYDHDKRVQD